MGAGSAFAACRTPLVSPTHDRGTVVAMAEDQAPDRLAVVRWNIARYRKAAGVSQADIAEKMTERGIKWFAQTVQKVENGSRTLRFDEAAALADCLGVEMWELLDDPAEVTLEGIAERFATARDQLREATRTYLHAQEQAAVMIDKLGDMGHEGSETVLHSSPFHAVLDLLKASGSESIVERAERGILLPNVRGMTEDSIMTRREPEHYGPSPEGSHLRLRELLERRRAWFGDMGEESSGGVDPETS